ncbi:MAG: hypothetical protein FWD73_17725 [Polyangiaceae bacterium]|nr:hypothetical protein [Polyangiaceae bacterium]
MGTDDDYWFLDIQLGDITPGVYSITTHDVVRTKIQAANVALLHRQKGAFVANYPATSGTITLVVGDANAAADRELDIDIRFPSNMARQVGCTGGQALGSAAASTSTTCTCEESDGSTFTCVPDVGFDYCCARNTGTLVPFTAHVSASACPSMCRVATGLPDYCMDVYQYPNESGSNSTGAECGTSRCEMSDWPQLVVTEVGADTSGLPIHVTAITSGTVQEAYYGGGCPNGIDVISCEYQFWRAPADQVITLQVAVGDQPPTVKDIPMREFNHCGNDLSYVHFSVQGQPPAAVIEDPVYISPCRMLP